MDTLSFYYKKVTIPNNILSFSSESLFLLYKIKYILFYCKKRTNI